MCLLHLSWGETIGGPEPPPGRGAAEVFNLAKTAGLQRLEEQQAAVGHRFL